MSFKLVRQGYDLVTEDTTIFQTNVVALASLFIYSVLRHNTDHSLKSHDLLK